MKSELMKNKIEEYQNQQKLHAQNIQAWQQQIAEAANAIQQLQGRIDMLAELEAEKVAEKQAEKA